MTKLATTGETKRGKPTTSSCRENFPGREIAFQSATKDYSKFSDRSPWRPIRGRSLVLRRKESRVDPSVHASPRTERGRRVIGADDTHSLRQQRRPGNPRVPDRARRHGSEEPAGCGARSWRPQRASRRLGLQLAGSIPCKPRLRSPAAQLSRQRRIREEVSQRWATCNGAS